MFEFIKKLFAKKTPKLAIISDANDAPAAYGADYWNNKWPMAPIIYNGRTLKTNNTEISIDVKNFICNHDNLLVDLLARYKLVKPTSNETAIAIQKWVVEHIQYKSDDVTNKCPEYWQFPFELLACGNGDCEDGAILMASMLINAGIPEWRVKCGAGYVQDAPTAPQGGHCYCMYLADRPDSARKLEWVILDWCYYEDSDTPIEQKPLARDGGYNNCYKDVWFTFNGENSWNQTRLEVEGRVAK